MEKTDMPFSHGEQDRLFGLNLLADLAWKDSLIDVDAKNPTQCMSPSDKKQRSEPRLGPVSRSGRRISATWKVRENCGSKPTSDKSELRPALVRRRSRPISATRKVKENSGSSLVSDEYSKDEMLSIAQILVDMFNDKREACIWSFPLQGECHTKCKEERNLQEPMQLKEKKCISDASNAQSLRIKRKYAGDERQEKAQKKMKGGPHICEICGKSFATGVQLGGHKRAHYEKEPTEPAKRWSVRKCVDSELHFYLTIEKND